MTTKNVWYKKHTFQSGISTVCFVSFEDLNQLKSVGLLLAIFFINGFCPSKFKKGDQASYCCCEANMQWSKHLQDTTLACCHFHMNLTLKKFLLSTETKKENQSTIIPYCLTAKWHDGQDSPFWTSMVLSNFRPQSYKQCRTPACFCSGQLECKRWSDKNLIGWLSLEFTALYYWTQNTTSGHPHTHSCVSHISFKSGMLYVFTHMIIVCKYTWSCRQL